MRISDWSSDVCSSDLHRGVAVETDQRTVGTAHALAGAHHDGVVDLALLDLAARDRILDRHLDDVANAGVPALGAAEQLDAHHFLGAGVFGHVQVALNLYHGLDSLIRPPARRSRPRARSWSSTLVPYPPPDQTHLRSE